MIEGLKMIEREKANTMNPVDPSPKMTDMIRSYSAQMDSMIEELYSSARVLAGDSMRFPSIDFPSPGCLMEDVKLLGERIKVITELCNIIGVCL